MDIKAQMEQGVYQKDIAASLGVHAKTVRRALKRGGAPTGKRPRPQGHKLQPYRGLIDQLLAEGVRNGVVIYRILREHGYPGKYTVVSDWLRPRRLARESRKTVRFETPPGRQLQSDWGEHWTVVAGRRTKAHFIVNTPGYSRRFHFWCTDSEDAEHTYEGIIRTFEYLGGVTKEVLPDYVAGHIIENEHGRHAAEVAERVLEASDEGIRRLPIDRFAVTLPRVGERDPKDMRPAPPPILDHAGAAAEINLRLFTGRTFNTPERERGRHPEAANEALYRGVRSREVGLEAKVLEDTPALETLIKLGSNDIGNGLTVTLTPVGRGQRWVRPGGRNGRF